jgi:hypothetical protein
VAAAAGARVAAAAPSADPAAASAAPVLAAVAPAEARPAHPAAASSSGSSAPRPPQSPPPAGTLAAAGTAPPANTTAAALKDAASLAVLRLTADPQAVVSVEGPGSSQTLATPVRALGVPPGRYRVTFRSETYGAPVVSEVMLAAGAHRSVHADFRAAAPSVIVR